MLRWSKDELRAFVASIDSGYTAQCSGAVWDDFCAAVAAWRNAAGPGADLSDAGVPKPKKKKKRKSTLKPKKKPTLCKHLDGGVQCTTNAQHSHSGYCCSNCPPHLKPKNKHPPCKHLDGGAQCTKQAQHGHSGYCCSHCPTHLRPGR